ncbi:MAG: RusA family crossover junction endodeoxyribonuclease [Clostridia bacterium]|nr:RusA family crossover junction endodeoxyribonuclease [Clostridia bacterium]
MSDELLRFTIPLTPITKKNSSQIVVCSGKPRIIPSKKFREYQEACGWFIHKLDKPIECKCNIKAVYYMPTRRRVDITNLHSALHDILVHYGIIADDNCKIVIGTDGSRVRYDKENPRTEVVITKVEEVTGFEV